MTRIKKTRELRRPPQKWSNAVAVLTTDGTIIKGDRDYRPGDPIIGPRGTVLTVERVIDRADPYIVPLEQPALFE